MYKHLYSILIWIKLVWCTCATSCWRIFIIKFKIMVEYSVFSFWVYSQLASGLETGLQMDLDRKHLSWCKMFRSIWWRNGISVRVILLWLEILGNIIRNCQRQIPLTATERRGLNRLSARLHIAWHATCLQAKEHVKEELWQLHFAEFGRGTCMYRTERVGELVTAGIVLVWFPFVIQFGVSLQVRGKNSQLDPII